MEDSLAEQRDELLILIGMLADPVRRLIEDAAYMQKLPFIETQFTDDKLAYEKAVRDYCERIGILSSQECGDAHAAAGDIRVTLGKLRHNGPDKARERLSIALAKARDAIRALPAYDAGSILPGLTPLTTYKRLLALCKSARTRIDLLDPYLDSNVILLYLEDIEPSVQVRVITSEDIMVVTTGPTKFARRDKIVAVSNLLAVQRPTTYQFRVAKDQHDRHLRVDDQIFHLGGSLKDASRTDYYTLSTLDNHHTNHAFLDGVVSSADEWFGLTVTTHRVA